MNLADQMLAQLSPEVRAEVLETARLREVHVTRLTDGKPLCLDRGDIRYGYPAASHTCRTSRLELLPRAGLVPYYFRREAKFCDELRVEFAEPETLRLIGL